MESNPLRRYRALAEEIFFRGLTTERLREIGRLKPDKTFFSVEEAFQRGIGRPPFIYESQRGRAAEELQMVICLNPDYATDYED